MPAKLAGTASTDMLRAVQVVFACIARLPVAAALPWSILTGRLDRDEAVVVLKRMVC